MIDRRFVAIAPLASYLSGLLASFPMRFLNKKLGRKVTMLIGLGFVVISSILFWFIVDFQNLRTVEATLILANILLGIGTTTTNICSFSLTSDLIGLNTECGAFVYGIMSFADKLTNGIVIALLQQFNPCTLATTDVCKRYYRNILTFLPIVASIATVVMIVTIWRRVIGGNRHEMVTLDNERNSDDVTNIKTSDVNEETRLLA